MKKLRHLLFYLSALAVSPALAVSSLSATAIASPATVTAAVASATGTFTTGASTTDRERVGDFALLDHNGRFHQMSRYADDRALVLFVHNSACGITGQAAPVLSELQSRFSDESVSFLLIDNDPDQSREQLRENVRESMQGVIDLPVLMDEAQLVTGSLGSRSAGEVFLLNPRTGKIHYRGPVNDQLGRAAADGAAGQNVQRHYLAEALQAVVENRPVSAEAVYMDPGGDCALDYRYRKALQASPPSYAGDIAPLLQERCVDCHRPGGIAPWAMTSHRMVQGWAPMMRETVMTKRMPPGQVDPHVGEFDDVNEITPAEKAMLVHWINAGAPKGENEADPLAASEPEEQGWSLGEPDLIVEFPAQEIPATGVIDYLWLTPDVQFEEDKWVAGFEFVVGDPSVVHHARLLTRQRNVPGAPLVDFATYAPGKEFRLYPEGAAQFLGKDQEFVLQMHYTTNGRATTDQTKLGLYFRDSPPDLVLKHPLTDDNQFVIPPNARDHAVSASVQIEEDSWLFAMSPHMHYRGSRMDYTARFPDGSSRQLLSVPNYRFNWQMDYWLEEPLFLPAGTEIVTDGAFDNSVTNPLNPDPSRQVEWGEQSWDEMFIGWMAVGVPREQESQAQQPQ